MSDSSGASSSSGSDGGYSDWDEGLGEALQTKSLFDATILSTPEQAIEYDAKTHNFDLREVAQTFDTYQVVRLINLIRRDALSSNSASKITENDQRLTDDSLLVPVEPNDPLLQYSFNDSWSDDDDFATQPQNAATTEEKLQAAQAEIQRLKSALSASLQDEDVPSGGWKGKGKGKLRDDDTHYFDSYADNEIHEIMLKDTVRTVSYGRFLLSNPQLLKGATVLDVGCGTGILSILAAKGGARKVYAVEASGLASKTRMNIAKNGLDGIITVIQGKMEEVEIPEKVDLIISEWMGYMLLYESMLDSVLNARDRFLKPEGVMAPSQTILVVSGLEGKKVRQERVGFWKNIYGFDMSPMSEGSSKEGLIQIVKAEEVVTDDCVVRDINTHTATIKSLDFQAPFTITATKQCQIDSILTHFDVFFGANRRDTFTIPAECHPIDTGIEAPVEPIQGPVSFTTGPRGPDTHWQQVVFLLTKPIAMEKGQQLSGKFLCKKSKDNSRELDVEIHLDSRPGDDKFDLKDRIEMYKVH